MPRRWLSIRTQKEGDKPTQSVAEGFDFAFGVKSGSPLSSPTSPDFNGPYVFSDHAHYARRKPDLTLLIERPQSSRPSSRFSGSFSGPRSGNSCIGVAFGSPHHPPQNFGASQLDMASPRHCFVDNPSPIRTPSVKKWKKIGDIFRPRANSDKGSSLQPQQHTDATTHKLGLPIHRSRWRNPKSPPITQDDFDTHCAPPRIESVNRRPRTSHGYRSQPSLNGVESNPFPSLQVKIPGSPFERYSVMFKNLNATPQLGIGRRRSYMKDSREEITPEPCATQPDINAVNSGLKRRVTSPTTSRPNEAPQIERPPSNPRPTNSSRYSLFPATPTTSRPPSQHRTSNQISTRPGTAPGQSLPQNEGSPPKKPRHESSVSNPTNTMIDVQKELPCLDSAPAATAETRRPSSHSRSSSSGEIFFDVKSLRGSKGMDVLQYEIARPPSTDLQLARSMSNARKQSRRPPRPSPTPEAQENQPLKPTSALIDDTIALVESLTSVASAAAVTAVQENKSVTPMKIISQHQQINASPPRDLPNTAGDNKRMRSPKSRSELNIAVPSPVLESIEEASPRTIDSRHSIAFVTEGPATTGLNIIAPRARANSNDTQISRAQLKKELPLPPPPPPAVPMKDSKLIPLSKYAPRHTAEELARHTGFRPVRPQRSNTDDSASYNGGVTVFRRQFPPGRSSTMPSIYGPAALEAAINRPTLPKSRFSPQPEQEIPLLVAYVQPSAEVSVARTVSLSRKSSAKITVSRQPSKNAMKMTKPSEEEPAEKKVPQRMPTLLEANSKHKPGLSQNAVVEVETTIPSSPNTIPNGCDFTKTLEVFPTPPMLSV